MNTVVSAAMIVSFVCTTFFVVTLFAGIHACLIQHYRLMVASALCLIASFLFIQQFCSITFPDEYFPSITRLDQMKPSLILLALFSVVIITLTVEVMHFNRRHMTREDIKRAADRVRSGILFYQQNGKIILSNKCMMDLCFELTGEELLNGAEFANRLKANPIILRDGSVWDFSMYKSEFEGKLMYEMQANDVTEIYRKTESLKKENEALADMTRRMKQYSLHIDETIRAKEILEAKIHIHDTMNRLMLSTSAAANKDDGEIEKIMRLWKSNAILLCRESAPDRAVSSTHEYSRMLGIELDWQGVRLQDLPESVCDLIAAAAQEALANAVKHADARKMKVLCQIEDNVLVCTFSNPCHRTEFAFGGGLENLNRLVSSRGGSLSVDITDQFSLTLRIPL